jgi:hypothetical protein
MRYSLIGTLLVGSVPMVAGCGDALSPESLAGTYVATTFTLSGAIVGDVLAEGGSLTITFRADGTTEGSLLIPGSLVDGDDFAASMVGTFTIVEQTIRLVQDADSFVRDLTWTVDGSELHASGTFSGVTITLVLTRQ